MSALGPAALAVLLATPVTCVAVHAALARALRRLAPQPVAMLAAIAGAGVDVAFALGVSPAESRDAAAVAYALVVALGLGYTYFHFFNMSETARRIRILRTVHRAGTLAPAELEALYRTPDIVRVRLERLVALGQIRDVGGRWVLASRALYAAARVVFWWRALLGFGPDELL